MKLRIVDYVILAIAAFLAYKWYESHCQKKAGRTEYMCGPSNGPMRNPMAKTDPQACSTPNFVASDLLPKNNDESASCRAAGFDYAPKDLQGMNFLSAHESIGIDTIGSSLRNANVSIREEPANPKTMVCPWNQSTIDPDPHRKSLC